MRLKIIKYTFFFLILLIVLRLWYWQVWKSESLIAKAENQRLSSREVIAPRGKILFSDGSTLASTKPVFLIFAQPKVVEDKELVSQKLGEIFGNIDFVNLEDKEDRDKKIKELEDDLLKRISQNLFWVSLGRRVDFEVKERIEKFGFRGIGFESSSARFYPEASSSAHLLGFVGSDVYGGELGYFGLEGFYNGELKGKDGLRVEERDALGLPILIGEFLIRQPRPGKTLQLHVDRTVQHIVEEKLKKGIEKYQAKEASAVVLDPETGGVLAMAAFPNYDPAKPDQSENTFFKNPITADAYEPGSTFKVLVMASAINEKLVKPETICDICNGPINIGGFTLRTWNNKYYPESSMTDVIIHSDNTGMVFVGKKLGVEKLHHYIQSFGFGELSGADLQDEIPSEIRNKDKWREIDLATASFGQGIAVTAMQMVKAVAAIANEGKLMEPHVVKKISDSESSIELPPKQLGQSISPEVAKIVTEMMVKAVDEGEAKFAKPKGFKIAGKTGTAQIPVAGHYDPNKTIASFVGFAPADNPKFVMLVRYREPSSSIFGSETAAPTFFEIAKELFIYFNIPPTE